MKKFLSLGLVCLLSVSAVFAGGKKAKTDKSKYPEFSWDHVNVCLHFANSFENFTDDEIKFMSQFPLVCIEKTQGRKANGSAEKGTEVAALALKAQNPKTTVLSYYNLKIDYGDLNAFGTVLGDGGPHPEWRLYDKNGKVQKTPTRYEYDISNPEFRKWWFKTAVDFSNIKGVDGIFIDGINARVNFPENQAKRYGQEKWEGIYNGFLEITDGIKTAFDKDKIVIGNGGAVLKGYEDPNEGLKLASKMDGAMTEHFCDLSGKDKDNIVVAIELIRQMAEMEKIFVVKGWPRYNFTNDEVKKNMYTKEEFTAMAREDITFPLACFLCGAGEYSYFCYSWGYRDTQGSLVDFAEYHKPLGKPKGDYKRDGYIFTREFEHLSVWVDVANRKAKLDWKK